MDLENVCSVNKENKLGFYRLHTLFNNDILKINVTSKDGAWTGQVSKTKLKEMSNDLHRPEDVYINDTIEALTTPGGKQGIVYAVEDNNFVWKAVDSEMGITMKLGGIPLQPASFVDTIQTMMQVSLDSNKSLQARISRLEQEKLACKQNVDSTLQKLHEFQQAKETMEDEVYAAFVTILNAKKNKIKELEVQLIEERAKAPKKRPRPKKNASVRVDEGYDEDTQDEEEEDRLRPSTSKASKPSAVSTRASGKARKTGSRKASKAVEANVDSEGDRFFETNQMETSSTITVEGNMLKPVEENPDSSMAISTSKKDVQHLLSSTKETGIGVSCLPSTFNGIQHNSIATSITVDEPVPMILDTSPRKMTVSRSEAFLDELLGNSDTRGGVIGDAGETTEYIKKPSVDTNLFVRSRARDIIEEFL